MTLGPCVRGLRGLALGVLAGVIAAVAMLLVVGAGRAGGGGNGSGLPVPRGYGVLGVLRWESDPRIRESDGGGLITSVQEGLTFLPPHRRARMHCRFDSIDKSGKTAFESDPQGTCALYFPRLRAITLIAQPDFRSTIPAWIAVDLLHPDITWPHCRPTPPKCNYPTRTVHVQLVLTNQPNGLFVAFPLRLFRLTVTNTDPSFGEAEDHDKQQVPTRPQPIDCGRGHTTCSQLYEYGSKPVLDALWDTSRSLTVTWQGCDPSDPIRTNAALCPVTMTRNRHVTVSWP